MPLSIAAQSTTPFIQHLRALDAMLGKLEVHCEAAKIEPEAFLAARLFPDMFTFTRQVQFAADFAYRGAARLAGQEPESTPDTEKTLPELRARLARAIGLIEAIDPAAIEAGAERMITFRTGPDQSRTETGGAYLAGFVLPNFYFHLTAAYALMRHNGLAIGKRDFFGGA